MRGVINIIYQNLLTKLLFSDSFLVRTQRHRGAEVSIIKDVRENTDLGKGMALCLCVSVFLRKGCKA